MDDTIFRTKSEPVSEVPANVNQPAAKPSGDHASITDSIEPPFTNYESVHHKPFTVDYFELGSFWNQDNAYSQEVKTVETFIQNQILMGKVDNSLKAVKEYMKDIEKLAGIKSFERQTSKMERIISYMKSLTEFKGTKNEKEFNYL